MSQRTRRIMEELQRLLGAEEVDLGPDILGAELAAVALLRTLPGGAPRDVGVARLQASYAALSPAMQRQAYERAQGHCRDSDADRHGRRLQALEGVVHELQGGSASHG